MWFAEVCGSRGKLWFCDYAVAFLVHFNCEVFLGCQLLDFFAAVIVLHDEVEFSFWVFFYGDERRLRHFVLH